MGVPRQRKTKSASRQKRSHEALTRIHLAKCKNCGKATMPHEVCPHCGFYRGRQVKTIPAVK
ncbi:MAG: 50S ribosomal protein L32 [Candidatus Doudnabacteria bacterium]|nr:50S ribosomal protein L32 [Candidatus Doudnabacteria bacterium]